MSVLRALMGRDSEVRSWGSDFVDWVTINGHEYAIPTMTLANGKSEQIETTFAGIAEGAYRGNALVFACMNLRAMLFSEARICYRQVRGGKRGDLFGTQALSIIEKPWPNATTGDLLARAELDNQIAGNSFWVRRGQQIKRLEPEWVGIVLGSPNRQVELPQYDPDLVVAGYVYQPPTGQRYTFLPNEIAHFAPTKDPLASYRGMSWVTPLVREVMADNAAASFKLKFFENGATPNAVVHVKSIDPKKFNEWVATFRQNHEGVGNAYRTMYLAEGSDYSVVGSNLRDMTFTELQGKAETRIAAAAGIPPNIVGFSEGLQGSALNAGAWPSAKQRFAHMTMHPLWRNFVGSFASIIPVPDGGELWFDTADIPFLAQDLKDAADIRQVNMTAINTAITAGFTPDSAVKAITAGDLTLLQHTGLVSVQLNQPGAKPPAPEPPVPSSAPTPGGAA